MTIQGAILIAFVATALTLWMLNLVRRGRLYIGYAVVCLLGFAGIVIAACFPPIRHGAQAVLDYFFPRTGVLVALGTLAAMALIYVLSQLTIMSNRLARTVQRAAMRDALADEADRPSGDIRAVESRDEPQASSPRTAQSER